MHFSLLVVKRNGHKDQSTVCQSVHRDEMHGWDLELACLHIADGYYRGESSGQREARPVIPDADLSGGSI